MIVAIVSFLSVLTAAGICCHTDAFCTYRWIWQLPVCLVAGFILFTLLSFGFLILITVFIDPDKQREKDSPFMRRTACRYIRAAMQLGRIRVHTAGMEKAPTGGRFLLVCNHLSDVDPAILLYLFAKTPIAFVSKKENRDMFIVGGIMSKLLCPLINRENDREALKTILRCVQLLQEDTVSVGVFPEGRIPDDRKLRHFRPGVFKIALKAKVPIVVCTLRNTHRTLKNVLHLKPTDIDFRLLDVIPYEAIAGENTTQISDRIYGMMAADLGSELVWQGEENT